MCPNTGDGRKFWLKTTQSAIRNAIQSLKIRQNCMRLSAAVLQTRDVSSLETGFSGWH